VDSLKRAIATGLLLLAGGSMAAQEPTLEYRVKAAYVFNFMKFVEWPREAIAAGPLTICVAGRNPFGPVLDEIVRGEEVADRPVAVRVILEPEPGCHVLFVPDGAATSAYLRAARTAPVLTVGETPDFISMGGIVRFVREGTNVRFEIDQEAADRVRLRVSSRLLRLARPADPARVAP
jgi:hypothetical protein